MEPPAVSNLVGTLLTLGASTCLYYAHRNDHMAKMIKNAPEVDLFDPELLKSLQKENATFFGKVYGKASTGPRNAPIVGEDVDQPLVLHRRVTIGKGMRAPWSPFSPFHLNPDLHARQVVTKDPDNHALAWGIQTVPKEKEGLTSKFLQLSQQITIDDDDLHVSNKREEECGLPFVSMALYKYEEECGFPFVSTALSPVYFYPYQYSIEDRTLPVGTPVRAIGNISLSKEHSEPIMMPAGKWNALSPKPTPTIFTTKMEEDWISQFENKAFNLKLISGALTVSALACFVAGAINKEKE